MGPTTLYTILGKFEAEQYIQETAVEGRKRTYAITEKAGRPTPRSWPACTPASRMPSGWRQGTSPHPLPRPCPAPSFGHPMTFPPSPEKGGFYERDRNPHSPLPQLRY